MVVLVVLKLVDSVSKQQTVHGWKNYYLTCMDFLGFSCLASCVAVKMYCVGVDGSFMIHRPWLCKHRFVPTYTFRRGINKNKLCIVKTI
jgi:hypothetical protein